MNDQNKIDELSILISAIRSMQNEPNTTLDWLNRYNTLVDCLIDVAAKQLIGRRSTDSNK